MHFVYIFIRHLQFLWLRNPNFVVYETNDGNHPGLGLDINIINQVGIDSGLEAILGLSRALLVVRKCENKRNLQHIALPILYNHQSTHTSKIFSQGTVTIFSSISVIDLIENIQVQSQSGVIFGPQCKIQLYDDVSAIFTF